MRGLGFGRADFRVFEVEDFSARMQQIAERIRPRLVRLGDELAPELSRRLNMEFFPHIPKHMRRSVNPPSETWTAWGPSSSGYKRYGYLALCVSGAGLHARTVVKSEADHRDEMALRLRAKSADLARAFRGAKVALYDRWDGRRAPRPDAVRAELFESLADALAKKTGGIDVGFGWPIGDAVRLDRAELLDAFAELEPFYRILRSVA